MLGLRMTPCSNTDVSPCEMVMGAPVTLPCVMLPEDEGRPPLHLARAIRNVLPGKPFPLSHHQTDRSWVPPKLRSCTHIFVKDHPHHTLQPRYQGPFKVLQRGDTSYLVQRGASRDAINISNLKPAEETVVQPDPPPQSNAESDPRFYIAEVWGELCRRSMGLSHKSIRAARIFSLYL